MLETPAAIETSRKMPTPAGNFAFFWTTSQWPLVEIVALVGAGAGGSVGVGSEAGVVGTTAGGTVGVGVGTVGCEVDGVVGICGTTEAGVVAVVGVVGAG